MDARVSSDAMPLLNSSTDRRLLNRGLFRVGSIEQIGCIIYFSRRLEQDIRHRMVSQHTIPFSSQWGVNPNTTPKASPSFLAARGLHEFFSIIALDCSVMPKSSKPLFQTLVLWHEAAIVSRIIRRIWTQHRYSSLSEGNISKRNRMQPRSRPHEPGKIPGGF